MPYINGQFVDKTQLASGGVPVGGKVSTDTGVGTVGRQATLDTQTKAVDNLKMLLMVQGLMNPKKVTMFNGLIDMVNKNRPSANLTAEQENQIFNTKKSLSIIGELKKTVLPDVSLPEAMAYNFSLKKAGGRMVPKEILNISPKYALLRQLVTKSFQGAKMSDQDIKMALTYVPDITDSADYAQEKLDTLERMLTQIAGGGSAENFSSSFKPSLDSFVSDK